MKIELLGWSAKGLRCPDAAIELVSPSGHVCRVSLIQMPNGTGKTTTLDCLRAAMDGSAASWVEERVMEFQDTERRPAEGSFVTTLRLNGSRRLVIEMIFHFDHGCVTYKTTFGSRNDEGYKPPAEVRRFLEPKFSELLFFDGELAEQLIKGSSETDASNIIDTFHGLYHAMTLREQAQSSYQEFLKSKKASGKATQVANLSSGLESLKKREQAILQKLHGAQARIEILSMEVMRLEKETDDHLLQSAKFKSEEAAAQKMRDEASLLEEQLLAKISENFPNPVFLDDDLRGRLQDLAANLNILKLPEPTSKVFFEELIQEESCICGREMNESARISIRDRAGDILGDNVNGFLNTLKSNVGTLCAEPFDPNFVSLLDQLLQAGNAAFAAKSELNNIRRRAADSGDDEVSKKTEELKERRAERERLGVFLDEALRAPQAGDSEVGQCLAWYRAEIQAKERRLAELTDSLDRKSRTDCLVELLNDAYHHAHSDLKRLVIDDANVQLREILKFNLVQIESIDRSVKLKSRASGSVGQNLSVGYVFLAGLLHGGGNEFPLVVDSPAGPLDDVARREIGSLLPKLVSQLVAFVIASERSWFVEKLASASDNDILYLTHLRRNGYTERIIPGLNGNVVSDSENGVVLEGREPFFALGEDTEEVHPNE